MFYLLNRPIYLEHLTCGRNSLLKLDSLFQFATVRNHLVVCRSAEVDLGLTRLLNPRSYDLSIVHGRCIKNRHGIGLLSHVLGCRHHLGRRRHVFAQR
jgi:hypothetical protein